MLEAGLIVPFTGSSSGGHVTTGCKSHRLYIVNRVRVGDINAGRPFEGHWRIVT